MKVFKMYKLLIDHKVYGQQALNNIQLNIHVIMRSKQFGKHQRDLLNNLNYVLQRKKYETRFSFNKLSAKPVSAKETQSPLNI